MSKLTDRVLRRGSDPDLDEFVQETITFWNFSRYQARVADGAPAYTGQEGEFHFVLSGGSLLLYAYASGAWYQISGGGGGTPALPFNSVQYNNAGAFGGDDSVTMFPDNRLALTANTKLVFDEDFTADTYIVYNSSNSYLEMYLDGAIRAQF